MPALVKAAVIAAQLYNGLGVYNPHAGIGVKALALKLEARGIHTQVLDHFQEHRVTACPAILVGHSMGGNAALRQARRCALAGKPPRIVVTIDPGRSPLFHTCAHGVHCLNIYNPVHPIGGQYVNGADNVKVSGVDHLYMPTDPRVIALALAAIMKAR